MLVVDSIRRRDSRIRGRRWSEDGECYVRERGVSGVFEALWEGSVCQSSQ